MIDSIIWHVYVLQCNDGSFYAGICTKVQDRLKRHNTGKASKYTRSRRPVELLYLEKFNTKSEALKREIEIKDFSSENKKKLIKFGLGQRFHSAENI